VEITKTFIIDKNSIKAIQLRAVDATGNNEMDVRYRGPAEEPMVPCVPNAIWDSMIPTDNNDDGSMQRYQQCGLIEGPNELPWYGANNSTPNDSALWRWQGQQYQYQDGDPMYLGSVFPPSY